MSLQIVVDMNLSAERIPLFSAAGWTARHWSSVGDPTALDTEIMSWALSQGRVVFTHDVGFGTLLAITHAVGPSVVLLRGPRVLPDQVGPMVVAALSQHVPELASGALLVVDESRSRIRILPF